MTEAPKAVFLSYASQDADAALRICSALRQAGIEVWFDQSELRGGDAWDSSIRRQIKTCALFMPVISANTCVRAEGYFRLEWKLAIDRSYLIAAERAFLLPVVIDGTKENDALLPERFREVQWMHLPGGNTPVLAVERVVRLLSAEQPAPPPPQPPVASLQQPSPAAASPPPLSASRSRTRWLLGAVPVGALLLAVLGYLVFERFVPPQRAAAAPPQPAAESGVPDKSIAVLPFVNMSADKNQEYFSDGLSEELIDQLTKIPDLRVPARTSSFYFKGKSVDIATIARKLHVSHVLEGSVRRDGNRLRVTAELIRADTGYDVWSETYDREFKDVFQVQDEIAGAVVAALKLKFAPGEDTSSHRTSNTDAYNQYLLGRQIFSRRTFKSYGRAAEAYRRAIALDPHYASAYAGLAEAEAYVADQTGDTATYAQAKAAAAQAVALAPDQADGYAARGFLRFSIDSDWAGAEADFAKAVALAPGDSDIQRRYSQLLMALGQVPAAIAAAKKAVAIDPLSELSWQNLDSAQIVDRDFKGAAESNRHALEINPESSYALNDLGTLQLLEGQAGVALTTYRKIGFEAFRLTGIVMAQHTLGREKESQQALDDLIARDAKLSAYQIAEVYAWRGEKDRAFAWLERAHRQEDGGLVGLKSDQLLNSLRGDPRYASLLNRLHLPQ